jgi:hypothetical protein
MLHHHSQVEWDGMMDAEIQADVDADAYEAHQRDLQATTRSRKRKKTCVFSMGTAHDYCR